MKSNIKKYSFIAIMIFLFAGTASAQLSANLVLGSPPAYLSDWSNPIAGQLLVNNATGATANIKLSTQLQDATGNKIAGSINATAQVIRINQGANIIRLDRVLQLENLQFTGSANALASSGKLSPGAYQLCVQLITIDGIELTSPQCRLFNQVNYQLPYLLYPADKTWLDANTAQTAITFRWSNLIPVSQEAPTYRIQVYEVFTGQTTLQALRSNQPILLIEQKRTTQYIWRPQLSFKDSLLHVFVWTLQTLDSRGIPVSAGDQNTQGRSEPRAFGICNKRAGKNIADCGADYKW
jgi:hypothetical protein